MVAVATELDAEDGQAQSEVCIANLGGGASLQGQDDVDLAALDPIVDFVARVVDRPGRDQSGGEKLLVANVVLDPGGEPVVAGALRRIALQRAV